VLLTAAIYWQGINGPFIFDDFPNLSPLGASGGVYDLPSLLQFLNTGFSGPTGRPVALISFLLDSNTWPASAEGFKRTNILLHLSVGFLVAWIVHILVRDLYKKNPPGFEVFLPIVCLSWWVLHPLWVSTVLYVVQRMAILAAFFSLLTVVLYLKARALLYFRSQRQSIKGYTLLISSGFSSCAAFLSKENAAVLPLVLLILELAFFGNGKAGRAPIRSFVLFVLTTASAVILFYLLKVGISGWDSVSSRRDFSVSERFWTQGRILWLYIADIAVPKLSTAGLFHHIEISRGPLTPATGLIGWSAIIGLLWFTARSISKLPCTFLAVWLFFASHIIESTTISLELYFEHRNYLPAVFLSLIFVDLLRWLPIKRGAILVLVLSTLTLSSALLYARVQTWTSYPLMIETWAKKAPDSIRANLEVSRVLADQGNVTAAIDFLIKAESIDPQSIQAGLWRLFLTCRVGGNPRSDQLEQLQNLLSVAESDGTTMQYLGYIAEGAEGACPRLSPSIAKALMNAYRSSPKVKGSRTESRLQLLLGMIQARQGNGGSSLDHFKAGLRGLGNANSGMLGVSWLAKERHYQEALQLLGVIEMGINNRTLSSDGANYLSEIRRLRANIEKDLAARSKSE